MSLQFSPIHSEPAQRPDAPVATMSCPVSSATGPGIAARGDIRVDLDLRHAGRRSLTLRYECVGAEGLPVIFVAGGISANRHAGASAAFEEAGWWDCQIGSGRALDPAHHRIVGFDWVGSDGALDVPLDPVDQVNAIAAVLDALEIDRVAAFVGCSYGAMVGLQFAALYPDRLQRLVAISGCHRSHPYASAWRALQRRAVTLGALQCDDTHGLALARQLALLSYRTPEEFDSRFGPARVVNGQVRVAAEEYLEHCGNHYASRTAATAFVRLSESIDLQALAPEAVRVPVTVVAVAEDRLVPVADAYDLVERLRGETRLHVVRSLFGHDAFLKEPEAIDGILREALLDVADAQACARSDARASA